MKKGLLFIFLLIGVHVIAQERAHRTAVACAFTPAFTYSPSTPCANSSITFTNATSNGTQSLGSSATTASYNLSGFSLTANSGQSLIIRMLIYGTGTSGRFLQVKSFVANGSTSAGATISTWALTANSTVANTGAGAASITAGSETIGSGVTNGGYSANGHQLQTGSGWPAAATNTVYEQFSITPNATYNLSLTSLSFTTRITGGSGSLNLLLQYSVDGGTTFLAIPFTGAGMPSGMTYDWNFGDATAHSGSTNPTHTYITGGTSYTVTLSAFDGSCTSTTSQTIAVTGSVIYVNAAAVGSNNGSSWANAFTTLQAGIDAAAACGTPVQVWVAANTYKPNSYPWASAGGSARDYAFALKNNVSVYGGFAGTETAFGDRNVATYITTLSGDIGTIGDNTDNCYHVVVGSGINNTAILDGFTITKGYAAGTGSSGSLTINTFSFDKDDGGGLITRSATPTINNCIFASNEAVEDGGAVYNHNSSPSFSNCTFSSNTARYGGAIKNFTGANPTISYCTFSSNTTSALSGAIGGAIVNEGASPTIDHCSFTSNTSTTRGGAIYNQTSSSPAITNCTFSLNTTVSEGGAIYNVSSTPSIGTCTFTSNTATDGGALFNTGSTPSITTCTFTSNTATSEGGAIYNGSTSPAVISGSTFQTNGADDGGAIYNNSSAAQITTSSFSGNTAIGDGGAIRNSGSAATINNCSFASNTANSGGAIQSSSSSITVLNSTFTGNSAVGGGAMQHSGSATITITNCSFTSNSATDRAGAIYNNGSTPTITSCTFTSNHCDNDGGAIYNNNSTVTSFIKCFFSENTSGDTGGGIANQTNSTNTITACVFSANTSVVGGGVYTSSAIATLTNCVITGNLGTLEGGGLRVNNSSSLTVTNCTFYNNISPAASTDMSIAGSSTVTVKNSIISGSFSYSSSTLTITYSRTNSFYPGTGNIITDPIFVNPSNPKGADNTWRTADDGLMIHCSSPAKNTGTATGAPADDIIGSARSTVDMGAYEQVAPPIVPSASIAITTGTQTICSGTSVEFTATPTNCGSSPSYQWQVNNITVGTNAATYTSTGLVNGDVVKCIITPSLDVCPSTTTATSNTVTMTVTTPPSATISYTTPSCSNGGTATVTLTGSTGGTFSSTSGLIIDGTTGAINLSSSTAAGYTVTYTVAAAGGCALFSTTAPITINTAPSASISYSGSPYCSNAGTASVSLTGTTGGTFSSTTGLVIDGTTGAINLSSSTAGTYTVTYTVAAANGCAIYTTTTSVTITAMPSATISYSGSPYCSNAGTANVSLTGTTGGVFSSTTGLVIDGTTGAINLSSSTAGTYTVTYTVAAANGCAIYTTTASVTITTMPSASINYAGTPYCSNAGTASVSLTGTTGGTFSSTTGLIINASTGAINLSSSTAGTYTVTYTVAAANGCAIYTTTTSVTITAMPSATISYSGSPYCSNAGTATVSLTGTVGGIFSSTTGLVIDGTTGAINLSSSTAGTYTVTYTVAAANGCAIYTTTASVTITTMPSANISYSGTPYCSNAGTASVSLTGTTGGAFSSTTGLSINASTGAINLSSSTAGTYIVTYIVAASGGCALFSTTASVTITTMPSASISYAGTPYCSNAGTANVTLTGSTGGAFSSTTGLVINASTGAINLSSSTAGTYTVTYTVAAANGCALFSTTTSVTITTAPSATINYAGSPYCSNAGTANVSLTGTTGGTFSSTTGLIINASTGAINLSSSTAGTYTVTYTIAATGGCATYTTTAAITINTALTASVSIAITSGAQTICAGTSVTFTATPTNGGLSPSYQWQVNGVNAGTNASTFTSSSLSNNALVTCILTSNEVCKTATTGTSNSITMTVNANLTPSISIAASATNICAGTSVTFTATPTNGGTSPSYQWKINGINAGTNASTFASSTFTNNDIVTCILTSNATCLTVATGTSNSVTMLVNPNLIPAISIAASATTICAGTNVTFTATATNGGTIPTYQWQVNGVNAGTNSTTFTSTTLNNNDAVTCIITSNATCLTTATATSNSVTMLVNPNLTPSISITASATTICAGTNVTFTATPTNGGASPSYQWKVNGTNAGTNSSTFTSSTLVNGNTITCTITSNATCLTTSTAISNNIVMLVNPNLIASITIAASATTICAGTSVTFTATSTNGGTSPIYQWKVNGVNAGTNASTFSSTTLNNGDIVTCLLASNATCVTPASANSNSITMTVNPNLTPSIFISSSATTICAGTNVTFTATATNGGAFPNYQWQVNGVNAGTNSTTFTSATLTNGNTVTCILTSNATCLTTATATSAGITMVVNPNLTPAVSIVASDNNVCSGTNVTFTATATNGGSSPTFVWQINGVNAGTSSTFTSPSLVNGNIVTCILTSNATCLTTPDATSNGITMIVNPNLTPTISIVASATTICAGTNVTFTATATNGGTTPTYQWKVNGINAGTNSSTFASITLNNSDVITCVLTSNATCVTSSSATSNGITMVVNPNLTPIISITATATTICAGTAVVFATTVINVGTSPIYQWKINGTNVGTNSATFTSYTLNNNDVVTCLIASNVACLAVPTGTSNSITMTVNPKLIPSVSIATTAGTICAGTSVTFTATATNGGTAPTYQWKINGSNVGTNSTTFTSSTLVNLNTVTCTITSNATCLTTSTAISNNIVMVVNPNLTPAITIAASATTICAGTSVTFTATAINGGTTATYQWKINGANVGTNSTTFTSITLSNSDIVTCVLTSSATCVTSATATSNSITIVVNPILTPSIAIAASATTICTGTSVTFTATPTNGGTTPTYQWKVNGTNAGTNSPTFTSSSLSNNDVITCILTSNATCLATTTGTSNSITMVVNPNLTPSISIAASATTICAGTSVTFTATPTNGGASPTYQWKVNGTNAGTNSNTFTTTTLVNANAVTCVLTSNATCLTTATATSNSITMTVNANLTPTVSIAASATTICAGTNVTFTATQTNGGTTPSYQWKVNGTNTGTNSSTFSSATLSNSDIVSCVLTSSATCVTSATATSNNITMLVNPILTPSISIASSATTICAGTSVTFTATPTNGGSAPSYQWKVNGTNAGTNSPTFTSSTLTNSNVITCVLTSNATCLSATSATSNSITMTVNPNLTPAISIAASATTICSGTSVTFIATPTNGGVAPTYQWKINTVNTGTNSSTFTSTTLNNGDVISCVLTSNATCLATPSSTSSGITMTVNPNLTPTISIVASTNNVCVGTSITFTATQTNGGTNPSYQWKVNGTNVGTNASTFTSTTLNNNDVVTCVFTSNATCLAVTTATSNGISISASTPVTPTVSVAVSANNICSNISVTFTATVTNEGTTPTYQWKINGVNVGTNASTFTSTTLNNNDVVICVLTTSAACATSPTATSNSITMIVTTSVTPTISIISSIGEICAGTDVTFTATSTNGGSTPIYQWQINGTNAGTNSTSFTTNTLAPNDVVTCSLTSSITCVTAATVVSSPSLVNVHPLPTVFAGPDKAIFTGGFTQIFATAFGNIDSIKWTPSTSLSYDTILQPIANPSVTTLYRLRVVTKDGCSATDDLEIKVVDGVFVPNAFSPNGDNINDKWEIPALADFPESFVQVFNRAGQLVFKATGYTNTKYWDGTKNGSPLPVGVYYYIIDFKNGNKPMSGFVTILK